MAKLRAALILMIIIVALASWYKNQKREEAKPALTPASKSIEMDSMPVGAPVGSPAPSPTPIPANARAISPENIPLVRECLAQAPALPRVHVTEKTTLDDLLHDLDAKPDSAKLNVHVKRANGVEERLLVQPHEKSSPHTYKIGESDLRVFNVDNEGLPIAKDFPRDLKRDSLANAVNAFIANDKVTFRERRSHFIFAGGVATSVETNGQLTELQLNFARTTLGCAWQNQNLNCACL
jgi:hypothetical protein